MITYKSKKTPQKQQQKGSHSANEKGLSKIKFNISMDNLRPFVEGPDSTRTTRKKSKYNQITQANLKENSKTAKSKTENIIFPSKFKRQGKSPDISREVSNQILQKIEANGVKFNWQDIQEYKSQGCEDEDWSHQAQWSVNHKILQFNQNQIKRYSNFQKNQSFASTIDPISMYYQMIEYNQKLKQYAYDYFIIVAQNIGTDQRTTLMIKNIPNKYTVQFLAEEIDKEHSNTYDFLYLPCDIKNNCNVGYGFINFISTEVLKKFYIKFHNKRWGKFKSQKICNLTYARLQGLQSLIEHFQNSKVMNHKDKKYQPIIRQFSKIDHLIKQQKSKSNKHS